MHEHNWVVDFLKHKIQKIENGVDQHYRALTGKKRSVEVRRNMSLDRTGTKFSEGHKRKIGLASARMWSIRKSKRVLE